MQRCRFAVNGRACIYLLLILTHELTVIQQENDEIPRDTILCLHLPPRLLQSRSKRRLRDEVMSHINTYTFLIHPPFPRFRVPIQVRRVFLLLRRGPVSTTVRPQLVSVQPVRRQKSGYIQELSKNLPSAIEPAFPALDGGCGGRADEVFGPPDGAEEGEGGRRRIGRVEQMQLAVAV